MFQKSRQKIVAAIMIILVVLLSGTLGIIYATSYAEVYQRNQNMLAHHIELFSLEERLEQSENPTGELLPVPDELINIQPEELPDGIQISGAAGERKEPDVSAGELLFEDDAVFRLSTFYSVVFQTDGTVLQTENGSSTYTDGELQQIAQWVIEGKHTSGTHESLIYRYAKQEEYTIVAFMDNTVIQESITTLFRNTLLAGGVILIVIFFLARYLAKKIVQPLEESYQKQRQFISDAGHELKTPVTVVNANAEVLEWEIGENQWLTNIRYENDRMSVLITQLLDLTRTENTVPQMTKVDLSRAVTGEVLALEIIAYEKKVALETQIQEDIFVTGNGNQLAQLTSILLDNAIRHSSGDSTVMIRLKRERSGAVLSVINEGSEIPANQKKQIFERFYRGDEARTGGEHRYGLGLAIAKAIVETHKGKIEVDCHEGLVEFRVLLPSNYN